MSDSGENGIKNEWAKSLALRVNGDFFVQKNGVSALGERKIQNFDKRPDMTKTVWAKY